MEDIIDSLIDAFTQGLGERQLPNYLDIKNGKLTYKIGYPLTLDPFNPLPSLVLDTNSHYEQHSLQSSSYPIRFDFSQMSQPIKQTIENRMSSHVISHGLLSSSLRYVQNDCNEIGRIQSELTQIMQDERINVDSFSTNCLTNAGRYDFEGNLIHIDTINIDKESKHYTQEESLLQRAPHPVRGDKRKKLTKQDEYKRKSQRQVLQQFKLLSQMFSIDKDRFEDKSELTSRQVTKSVLGVVSLADDANYNDLWDEIVKELQLGGEKKEKFSKISNILSDEQFNEVINRIMSEATEYEQQAMVIEDEGETVSEEEKNQVDISKTTQQQQKPLQEIQLQLVKQRQQQQQKRKLQQSKKGFQAIKIQKPLNSSDKSKYQYAIEDNSDLTNFYDILPKQKFAIQYPFELDEFQKRSILHLQKKQSVFVAAHTSAGKTVVAEYGIALAQKHKRKVIYTSPIKALSNQKYRQLSQKFQSVGIVTGDVSLNQQATCVIMTTQILRNNLYRGAQMIRDIEWVIFDQVHYINNQQRGVVWQETIIMLPEHIGVIMLSATVPNYMEFANWVGRTKRRMIYVMKTFHRPVPLEHSLYIFNKFHTIKQANGRFLEQEYNDLKHQINLASRNQQDVKKALKQQKKKKIQQRGFYNDNRREQKLKLMTKSAVDKFIKRISKNDMQNAQGRQQHRVIEQLVDHCRKKNLLPAVVFTFSKKKINAIAAKIYQYDLTSSNQKSKIRRLISHALSTLRPEDQTIQQFEFLTMICMNGYAIHHGDLLPLAKQIVELLFSQGLIKVLFATQTFAMGINMPTKTVIFNSIKKVTGSDGGLRFLNSSEYVQMSGRAGRRGLDQKGTVIIIVKDPSNLPPSQQMVKMIDHPGERLQSKFRVTYQIILNLFNSKDMNVEQMMRQSFLENPKFSQYTSNIRKTKDLKNQYEQLSQFECPFNKLGTRILIEQYNHLSENIRQVNSQIFPQYDFKKLSPPKYIQLMGHNNQLQMGLLLKVDGELRSKGVGSYVQIMIVNELYLGMEITKEQREEDEKKLGIKKRIKLKYDTPLNPMTKQLNGQVQGTNNKYHYYISWVKPSQILQIYENKLLYKRQLQDNNKQVYAQISRQLLPEAIPKKLMAYNKLSPQLLQEKKLYFEQYKQSHCHNCQLKDKHQAQYEMRKKTKGLVLQTAKRINKNELGLLGSFEGMIKLLNEFNFIKDNTLTLKGRIARQVEIYVAQVIVQAVLDPLNSAQIAALLSAFVCDYKPRINFSNQKTDMFPFTPINPNHTYTDNLDDAIAKTLQIVTKITDQQLQSQSYINAGSQQQLIFNISNFHLCDTVYKWAIGFDFADAIYGSGAPQGMIVKTIMRLNMLMGNVKSVCRLMGNSQLERKIDDAVEMIKRDIVFCQSLYLTG